MNKLYVLSNELSPDESHRHARLMEHYIYSIRHNPTGRYYIGMSKHPYRRIREHIIKLRKGKHPVPRMQKDYNEHGEDYTFELLDEIGGRETHRIRAWQNLYNSVSDGYNCEDIEEITPEMLAPERTWNTEIVIQDL